MEIFHKLQFIPKDYKSILCSNKITNHSSQLLKNIQSKTNLINNQFYNNIKNQTQQERKLIKNPFKKTFIQFFKRSKSHTIHNDNNNNILYDKLLIKRTFGTAPLRNRIKTQVNKQNILNCEQLMDKKITNKSYSTVFNLNKQIKHKLKKSKPNIIYSSSKLPKDFFTKHTRINQYIQQIKKQSQQNQNIYEYLNHINQDIKTSEKVSSCSKISSLLLLNQNKNKNQKLKIKTQTVIDDQLFSFSNQSSNNSKKIIEIEEEFTFRKSVKNIPEKSNNIKNIHNSSSSKFYKQNHEMNSLDKEDKKYCIQENNDFLKVSPVNFYQAQGKKKTSNINKNKKPSQLLKL